MSSHHTDMVFQEIFTTETTACTYLQAWIDSHPTAGNGDNSSSLLNSDLRTSIQMHFNLLESIREPFQNHNWIQLSQQFEQNYVNVILNQSNNDNSSDGNHNSPYLNVLRNSQAVNMNPVNLDEETCILWSILGARIFRYFLLFQDIERRLIKSNSSQDNDNATSALLEVVQRILEKITLIKQLL